MARYEWPLIKREYIQGYEENGEHIYPTLEELCERHGCTYSTITKRSSRENWKTERKLYGKKLQEKVQEKRTEIMVEESASIDNKALEIAQIGLDLVKERLEGKPDNPDALKLSNTATNFHRMARLAMGEETEHVKETGHNTVDVNEIPSDSRKALADIAATLSKSTDKPR